MARRIPHVLRAPLPWHRDRPVTKTECGREATGRLEVITHSQWQLMMEEWAELVYAWRRAKTPQPPGVQRPPCCAVCWEKASIWKSWDRDPLAAILRVIEQGTREEQDDLRQALKTLEDLRTWHSSEFWSTLNGRPPYDRFRERLLEACGGGVYSKVQPGA